MFKKTEKEPQDTKVPVFYPNWCKNLIQLARYESYSVFYPTDAKPVEYERYQSFWATWGKKLIRIINDDFTYYLPSMRPKKGMRIEPYLHVPKLFCFRSSSESSDNPDDVRRTIKDDPDQDDLSKNFLDPDETSDLISRVEILLGKSDTKAQLTFFI